ncbi:hypothetical protein JTE90_001188 [Oedothorax gibbosus]|uniref:Ig-like domain-containing protein n=1 Tax=Oedothorax gibbosus TaxID=931172 RepID=A0AAV6UUE3_9ARAC|nr:hypothetical protein JTE90_001188 [Oedothorax gibbosus]
MGAIAYESPPKIQPFIFPTNVVIGQKASVSCTAISGDPPLDFRWLKNGKEISSGGSITIRNVVDVSVLVIDSVDATFTANYTCQLRTSGGLDSYTASLNVKEPSKWLNSIQDQDLKAGDNKTIECKADGIPPPKVVWTTKSDPEEMTMNFLTNQLQVAGSSKLLLHNAKPEDSGYYSCTSDNGVESSISRTILINILAFLFVMLIYCVTSETSLRILPFSFPLESSIIGKRVLTMCAPTASEKVEFKWLRNGKEISKGLNVDIRTFSDFSNLVIDPLTEDDSGNYTCVATSKGRTASFTTSLKVLVPPEWKSIPLDVDALSGNPVLLECLGYGTPKPSTNWYRTQNENLDFLPLTESTDLTIFPNGSLLLNPIDKEDEGLYKCNVSNGIGNGIAKTVVVRVIVLKALRKIKYFCAFRKCYLWEKMSLTMVGYMISSFLIIEVATFFLPIVVNGESPLQITPFSFPAKSVIGKRVIATCAPSAGEKLDFKWLRNGQELSKSVNLDIRSYSDLSNLVIDPLTEEDTGNYTCIISANGMTASYTTTLQVLVPPVWKEMPHDIDARSGDSLLRPCIGTGMPNPSTTWYRTQSENNEFVPFLYTSDVTVSLNGSLVINSVRKEDEGLYKCNVSNGIGPQLLKTIVVRVIVHLSA